MWAVQLVPTMRQSYLVVLLVVVSIDEEGPRSSTREGVSRVTGGGGAVIGTQLELEDTQ